MIAHGSSGRYTATNSRQVMKIPHRMRYIPSAIIAITILVAVACTSDPPTPAPDPRIGQLEDWASLFSQDIERLSGQIVQLQATPTPTTAPTRGQRWSRLNVWWRAPSQRQWRNFRHPSRDRHLRTCAERCRKGSRPTTRRGQHRRLGLALPRSRPWWRTGSGQRFQDFRHHQHPVRRLRRYRA